MSESISQNANELEDRMKLKNTWSIEPRLFQWPWRNPYTDFKVRPFLTLNVSKMAADTAIVTMEG